MGKQTLDQWITEVSTDPEKDGPLTAISCVHRVGMSDDEVYSVKLGEKSAIDPKKLAELFLHKARTQVQDVPGSQLFYLYAFYAGRNEPQAKIPFRVNSDADLGAGATDPPTPTGAQSQAMRFAESAFQFSFRHTQELLRQTITMNDMLMRQNSVLMRENHDAVQTVKELILKQASDQHEYKMKEMAFVRDTEERRKWLQYGPMLINSLFDKPIFPTETADTALIESICENLNKEQIEHIAQILPPHLMGPLAQRATKYLKEKQSAQEAAAKALGNGHDDESSEIH